MNYKFVWWNLPQQIKEKLNTTLTKNWFKIPTEVNKLLDELKVAKPNCYTNLYPNGHNVYWFNLPFNLSKVLELADCVEPVVMTYNFDVTANWATGDENYPVTDQASFEYFLGNRLWNVGNNLTDIVITKFSLVDGRLKCNINANGTSVDFANMQVTDVVAIGEIANGLTELYLDSNQLTSFNPSIALPSSLTYLYLYSNQLTSFNPSIALPSSLTDLNLYGNQLTSFNPSIALPSSLTYLYLNSNQLTSFNPSIALPSSLTYLNLNTNQLTSFNPSIALPSSLTYLNLYSNQLTSFNPSIALPSSLTYLYLNTNQLTSFNPSIALPSSLTDLNLYGNQLTLTSYTEAEQWVNLQTIFSNCQVYTGGNTSSAIGTNFETILNAKNAYITE